MTDETTPTPRKKRTPKVSTETKPRRHRKSGAAATIDRQLSEALQERSAIGKKLAEAAGYQARYQQLSQEINELMGMQARMSGVPSAPARVVEASPYLGNGVPYNPAAPIPPGVGSIPPREAKVSITPGGNAAELVSGDGGFK